MTTPLSVRVVGAVLRHIPPGLGDFRAANTVYRRVYEGASVQVTQADVSGATMSLDMSDWPQAQAYLLGRYDPATVQFICDHLPDDGCFIDGGAHVGLVTAQVAVRRPRAKVYAFEPHPRRYEALAQNIALNRLERCTAVQKGLSESAGTLMFDPLTHSVEQGGDRSVPVEVVTLDEFLQAEGIERVDVVKLDIEGHELAALNGASQALEAGRIRAVTMERLHGDIGAAHDRLLQAGYKMTDWPDLRPRWLRARRPHQPADAGYILGSNESS
jgi:FkbM family methyltransferase